MAVNGCVWLAQDESQLRRVDEGRPADGMEQLSVKEGQVSVLISLLCRICHLLCSAFAQLSIFTERHAACKALRVIKAGAKVVWQDLYGYTLSEGAIPYLSRRNDRNVSGTQRAIFCHVTTPHLARSSGSRTAATMQDTASMRSSRRSSQMSLNRKPRWCAANTLRRS